MNRKFSHLSILIVILSFFSLSIQTRAAPLAGVTTRVSLASDGTQGNGDSMDLSISTDLRASPVMFIENIGQFGDGARFQVRGGNSTIWLAEDALWVTVFDQRPTTDSQLPRR